VLPLFAWLHHECLVHAQIFALHFSVGNASPGLQYLHGREEAPKQRGQYVKLQVRRMV
jgi:hypothetical protein